MKHLSLQELTVFNIQKDTIIFIDNNTNQKMIFNKNIFPHIVNIDEGDVFDLLTINKKGVIEYNISKKYVTLCPQ